MGGYTHFRPGRMQFAHLFWRWARTPVVAIAGTAMRLTRLLPLVLLVPLLATGCEHVLFRYLNRGLSPPEQTIVYAPELGLSMDVYRPLAAPAEPWPVVVFFYGGSWQRGERAQYRFVGRQLARHGVLAVVADYRTYPRAGFPDFMDDAARAVRRVRDEAPAWGGDPHRIFLAGHSAGAHIVALLGTDSRYLQRYGISPRSLAGVIGLSGPYDFEITGDLRPVFGSEGSWPQAQPVNFVDGNEPPFLLIHGERDRVVESADSVQLAKKLKVHGVKVELELLPEGSHSATLAAIYNPQREPRVMRGLLGFIGASTASDAD